MQRDPTFPHMWELVYEISSVFNQRSLCENYGLSKDFYFNPVKKITEAGASIVK